MDMNRKKQLLDQWKDRHPEMGVVAISCKHTGEAFATISKDTQFAFNRHRFQLSAKMHPNQQLQSLWEQYGEAGFSFDVVKVLKYETIAEDQTDKLMALLDAYLEETPKARRL